MACARAQILVIHGMMQAYLALVLSLATGGLAAPASARLGYEREIDASQYNLVPKHFDYILTNDFLSAQKNRAKLVTKVKPEEAIASDNVILESNVVRIVKPSKRRVSSGEEAQAQTGQVRRRRGYNLENVRVPARYPYLPVAHYTRFRRWGY